MKTIDPKPGNLTREALLKLLSDDENASVARMESAPRLTDGEHYVDLEHTELGVRQVLADTKLVMGHVLPRSAVKEATWTKICARLGEHAH
jgi:hypothetical protein